MNKSEDASEVKWETDRWTLHITTWKPYDGKWSRRSPARRRRVELHEYWKGSKRIAQDRRMWKHHAETFARTRVTMVAQWRQHGSDICQLGKSHSDVDDDSDDGNYNMLSA